ncbi:MAG: VCBS repeat-containing protein [Myxococcales bacterium]|nr:VCBS repeat-containing protein [Myxococcales bacterium]
MGVVLWAAGCGDDGAVAESGSTGTSLGDESLTADGDFSGTLDATGPTTTVTTVADTSGTGSSSSESSSSGADTSSTGEPVDPLGQPVSVALGVDFSPLALEPGDFDGDGGVDLLITGTDAGTVVGATRLGDGAGGFAAAVDAAITACSAFGVVGRVDDGDDADDLFFGVCNGDGVFYGGQPGGGFAALDVLPDWAGAPVVGSRFGDVDGDGDDDLAVFTTADGVQLHVATHGAPPWSVSTRDVDGAAWDDAVPSRFRLGDLDGDAMLDAVFVAQDVGVAVVFDLADDPVAQPLALGVAPWSAELVDLESDGDLDIVVSSLDDHALQLLANDGSGEFVDGGAVSTGDLDPFEVVFGDFDGDLVLDVAILDDDSPELAYGLGVAGLATLQTRTLGSPAIRLHARDLDGNGTDDLVAATFEAGTIEVLLSGG